jgi:hypothetical protein
LKTTESALKKLFTFLMGLQANTKAEKILHAAMKTFEVPA